MQIINYLKIKILIITDDYKNSRCDMQNIAFLRINFK